jgi:hypothetical protein
VKAWTEVFTARAKQRADGTNFMLALDKLLVVLSFWNLILVKCECSNTIDRVTVLSICVYLQQGGWMFVQKK